MMSVDRCSSSEKAVGSIPGTAKQNKKQKHSTSSFKNFKDYKNHLFINQWFLNFTAP